MKTKWANFLELLHTAATDTGGGDAAAAAAAAAKGGDGTAGAAGSKAGDTGVPADAAGAQTPEQIAAAAAAAEAAKGTKAGAGADDKGGKDGAPPAKPEPPASYTLKTPDGATGWIDDADLKSIEAIARAKGWSNEQAQAALDEHADSLAAQSAAFRTETEAHPVYGGDNLIETQRLAALALDKVRPANTPEGKALRGILAKSGYGNNVHIVGFLADLGKQMAEDMPPGGSSSRGDDVKDHAKSLYGGTDKK